MLRFAVSIVMATLICAGRYSEAQSQTCLGYGSLENSRLRLTGAVASYTYADAMAITLTAGNRILAGASVGRTWDSELDATTLDVAFEVGYNQTIGADGRVALCPIVSYGRVSGPNEFLLRDVHYQSSTLALEAAVGIIAVQSSDVAIVPSATVRRARITVIQDNRQGSPPFKWKADDSYWLLGTGIGVIINEVLTIRPGITVPYRLIPPNHLEFFAIPFGREDREVSLNIAVGVNLWKRRGRTP